MRQYNVNKFYDNKGINAKRKEVTERFQEVAIDSAKHPIWDGKSLITAELVVNECSKIIPGLDIDGDRFQ